MERSTECILVKEEDLDWLVYHLLLDGTMQDREGLISRTGCSSEELAASLERLELSFLIAREENGYRVQSIQEAMLACQSKYDPATPFIIENGIIKEKKGPV
jgi:hypothetical protein